MGPPRWDQRDGRSQERPLSNNHETTTRGRDRPASSDGHGDHDNHRGGRSTSSDAARRGERGYPSARDNGPPAKRQRGYEDSYDDARDRRYRSDTRDDPRKKDSSYYGRDRDNGDDDYYGRPARNNNHSDTDRYSRDRDDAKSDRVSRNSKDEPRESDWKCRECLVWNYPDEKICSRCGRRQPRNDDKGNNDESLSEDEFGRKIKKKKNAEEEWPPCFQDHSEAFVLDSRSGMFYEEKSDFFYDPTSKLYYGNKRGAYFSYDAEKDTFIPVDSSSEDGEAKKLPPAGSKGATNEDQDHLMLVPHGANHKTEAEPSKQMIAIKIKTKIPTPTKKKKKRLDSAATDSVVKDKDKDKPPMSGDNEAANVIQKQHEASLMRWSERQEELAKGTGTNAAETRPRFTKHGKPICWVCKRKFDNLEKLRMHEEMSTMHKENLAKQKDHGESVAKHTGEESGRYVDRAQQRRDLYGPELTLPEPLFHAVNASGTASALPTNDEPSTENATNVGQQMLQKLGWKEGTMLGRGNEQQKEQQAALAQDWDRIESLAAKNKQSGGRPYRS